MKKNISPKGEIVIYKSSDGKTQLEVKLEDETVWLNLNELSKLLDKDKSVISRHIKNIFKEGELDISSTVAKFATVQKEGKRLIKREIEYYNLDVIISVGYRVKSIKGTQFRIWANSILKEYIIKGYALNEKRLKGQGERIRELEKTLEIFSKVVDTYQINKDEFSGILKVVYDYTRALDLLDDYDYQRLEIKGTNPKEIFKFDYYSAKKIIEKMKEKFRFSKFFGREKDESLKGILGNI